MATKLHLMVGDEGTPVNYLIREDFDVVMDRMIPVHQPANALEARALTTFTLLDNRRIHVQPSLIGYFEEDGEEE